MARLLLAVMFLLVPTSRGAEPTFHGKTLRQWEAQLRKGTVLERCRAAMALGMGPFGKKAVPALVEGLAAKEGEVRQTVLTAFRYLGKESESALPALQSVRKTAGDEERRLATWAMIRSGEVALPFFREQEDDPDFFSYLFSFIPVSHPELEKALLHERTRRRAVEVIHSQSRYKSDFHKLVPSLILALKDKRDDVRESIYRALTEIGAGAKEALPTLVERLDHKVDAKYAVSALMAIGKPAWPVLRQGLEKGPPAKRLLILKELRPIHEEALPLLLKYLGDPDKEIRRAATAAASSFALDLSPHLSVLKQLQKDEDMLIRFYLYTETLNRMVGDVEAARLLAKGIQDPEKEIHNVVARDVYRTPWLRSATRTQCLSYLRDPETRAPVLEWYRCANPIGSSEVENLCECLKDERKEIRELAIRKLLETEQVSSPVVNALCAALSDKETSIRLKAISALAEMGPRARRVFEDHEGTRKEVVIPTLLSRLRDDNEKVRREAAAALCRVGHPTEQAVRLLVVTLSLDQKAMGCSGDAGKAVTPWLVERLKSKDPDHRAAAATALGALGSKARVAVPTIAPLLDELDGGEPDDPAWSAVHALANMGESAVPHLKKTLGGRNYNLRYLICKTLRMETPGVQQFVPTLLQMIEDEDRKVRDLGWHTLISIEARGDQVLKKAMTTLEKSPMAEERRLASCCLSRLGKEAQSALPILKSALLDPHHEVREEALNAMVAIDPHCATLLPMFEERLLSRIIDHPQLEKLGKAASPLMPHLRRLCKCEDEETRFNAALGLWHISGQSEETIGVLQSIIDNRKSDRRVLAMRTMHSIASDKALPILVRLLEEENEGIRGTAALLIGESGKEAKCYLPRIKSLLKSPSYAVRETATRLHFHMTRGYDPFLDFIKTGVITNPALVQ